MLKPLPAKSVLFPKAIRVALFDCSMRFPVVWKDTNVLTHDSSTGAVIGLPSLL